MSAKMETTPVTSVQQACGAVDLTPGGVDNWGQGAPIVFMNPQATLHQKVALAWSMSTEIERIAEAAMGAANDEHLVRSLSGIVWERLSHLNLVLAELGRQTAGWDVPKGGKA